MWKQNNLKTASSFFLWLILFFSTRGQPSDTKPWFSLRPVKGSQNRLITSTHLSHQDTGVSSLPSLCCPALLQQHRAACFITSILLLLSTPRLWGFHLFALSLIYLPFFSCKARLFKYSICWNVFVKVTHFYVIIEGSGDKETGELQDKRRAFAAAITAKVGFF